MGIEFIVNGGVESLKVNPWVGVSVETLIKLGAKDVPLIVDQNQWWRLLTPIVLHAGIIHVALNVVAQILLGIHLERRIGWWRVGLVYLLGGVAGNLTSAIFLPDLIEVGASGAIYGLSSYYIADLIVHWSVIEHPRKYAMMLAGSTLFGFCIGLLPTIDNFAHIGGSVAGFLISLCMVPPTDAGAAVSRRAKAAMVTGYVLIAVFFFRMHIRAVLPRCSSSCL